MEKPGETPARYVNHNNSSLSLAAATVAGMRVGTSSQDGVPTLFLYGYRINGRKAFRLGGYSAKVSRYQRW